MIIRTTIAALLLSGCALTTATPVTDENPNPEGFIVNATSTKVITTGNGVQALTYSDPCKRYAVNFWAVFAKNDTNMTLNGDGTLQNIHTKLDSTEVPIKLIDLAGKVADKVLTPFDPSSRDLSSGAAPQTLVFDIVCGKKGQSYLVHQQTITAAGKPVVHREPPAGAKPPRNISVVD